MKRLVFCNQHSNRSLTFEKLKPADAKKINKMFIQLAKQLPINHLIDWWVSFHSLPHSLHFLYISFYCAMHHISTFIVQYIVRMITFACEWIKKPLTCSASWQYSLLFESNRILSRVCTRNHKLQKQEILTWWPFWLKEAFLSYHWHDTRPINGMACQAWKH